MALSLNMDLTITPELRQLGVRVGIGGVLLAIAVYFLAVMPLLESRKLDTQLAEEKASLARQQSLMPAMASISSSAQNASLAELLPQRREPVARTQVYLMPEQLGHMARAVGLEPIEVTLDPASMAQDPGSIQAQGVFAGEMDGMKAMLVALARMPSLERLEHVELRAVDGRIEMLVQLRIALVQ